eukprot:TRINITY_DN4488_c0_g1_i3.p1 TRINITY_DN4488_c0_g1~~TRINITY_DN4488_c0_g1_i3.p1  ORF type:complete len:732 (-),score=259.44 TRINITY_DN4488_c0_g1_i3:533-2728(-)
MQRFGSRKSLLDDHFASLKELESFFSFIRSKFPEKVKFSSGIHQHHDIFRDFNGHLDFFAEIITSVGVVNNTGRFDVNLNKIAVYQHEAIIQNAVDWCNVFYEMSYSQKEELIRMKAAMQVQENKDAIAGVIMHVAETSNSSYYSPKSKSSLGHRTQSFTMGSQTPERSFAPQLLRKSSRRSIRGRSQSPSPQKFHRKNTRSLSPSMSEHRLMAEERRLLAELQDCRTSRREVDTGVRTHAETINQSKLDLAEKLQDCRELSEEFKTLEINLKATKNTTEIAKMRGKQQDALRRRISLAGSAKDKSDSIVKLLAKFDELKAKRDKFDQEESDILLQLWKMRAQLAWLQRDSLQQNNISLEQAAAEAQRLRGEVARLHDEAMNSARDEQKQELQAKAELSRLRPLADQNRVLHNQCQSLTDTLDKTNNRLQDTQAALKEARDELQDKSVEASKGFAAELGLQKELDDARNEIAKLKREQLAAGTTNAELEELERLREEVKEMDERCAAAEHARDQLRDELQVLEEETAESSRLEKEMRAVAKARDEAMQKVSELEDTFKSNDKISEEQLQVHIRDFMAALKAEVIYLDWKSITDRNKMAVVAVRTKGQKSQLKVFKLGHLDIKQVVVTTTGDQSVGEKWEIGDDHHFLSNIPNHKYVRLFKSLQQLVISYENMTTQEKQKLVTAHEVLLNSRVLLLIARFIRKQLATDGLGVPQSFRTGNATKARREATGSR